MGYSKGIPPMGDSVICLYTLGQKFWLDTPRGGSSLWRVMGTLLKFTREYRGILVCCYPLGQTLKHHGVPLWDSTMEPFVLPKQQLVVIWSE